jgi:hypothetical protein
VRGAAEREIEAHQSLLTNEGKDPMKSITGRKKVVFELDNSWNALWPKDAKTNQMAYKGLGNVKSVQSNG